MHEYTYPHVVALEITREQFTTDDFGKADAMEAIELGPRIIAHNENQVDYYSRQLETSERDLAKLSLIYSGQLQFDFGPPPGPPQEMPKVSCNAHPGGGCDCGSA